jgi:predicted TIM-barrel fold metal-dependent hydrolase
VHLAGKRFAVEFGDSVSSLELCGRIMPHNRRSFLQAAAAVSLAASATSHRAFAWADDSSPIIDTHQHLWDRDLLNLPWLANAEGVLTKSYRESDYLEATKGLNIRAVYMEVDVADDQHDKEADLISAQCREKNSPTIAAVIGGRPDSPKFSDYAGRHAKSGVVRGVRRVLHSEATPKGHCLQPAFVEGVRSLAKHDLSFDLCMRPTELGDGFKLSELCPDTRFIVDHCGNADPKVFVKGGSSSEKPTHTPDEWKRSMEHLAGRSNVICKISGIVAAAPKDWRTEHLAPIVNFCLDAFGPDRVVFGSDWPVCLMRASLQQWVTALREIVNERPADQQAKLWSGNALKRYKLEIL